MEYMHMMGEGEDREEFAFRLMQHGRTPDAAHIVGRIADNFITCRREYLEGRLTRQEREVALEQNIQDLLAITGPVEPSTEFVGYF